MRGILVATVLGLIGFGLVACHEVDEPEVDDRHDAGTESDNDSATESDPEGPAILTEVVFEGEPGGTVSGGFTTINHDMDGDGLDEALVVDHSSVPDTTSYPSAQGAIYIFYGRDPFDSEYSVLDADAILRGASDLATAAGDMNGDGLGDIAFVSQYGAHIIYGSATRLSGELLSTSVGVHLTTGFWCGKISGGSDVNGDQLDDLLIDVSWSSSESPQEYATYLLLGRDEDLPSSFELEDADAIFEGEGAGFVFHSGSGMAGDVDGDGFGDVLIALEDPAPELDQEVGVAIFYGGPYAFAGSITPDQSDAVFDYPAHWYTIGGLGDLDHDGFGEISIPDPETIHGVYGTGTRFEGLVDISAASFTLLANADYGYLASIETADLNGDSWLEVIVGDPHEATNGFQTGALFVIWGDGGRLEGDYLLDGEYAVKYGLDSEDDWGDGENLGYGLGGGGDVNGDGYSDILVGAVGNVDGDDCGGSVYLLLGGPPE